VCIGRSAGEQGDRIQHGDRGSQRGRGVMLDVEWMLSLRAKDGGRTRCMGCCPSRVGRRGLTPLGQHRGQLFVKYFLKPLFDLI
jgi:hypothetical protein